MFLVLDIKYRCACRLPETFPFPFSIWSWFKFLKISIFLVKNKLLPDKLHHSWKLSNEALWLKQNMKNSANENCSSWTFVHYAHIKFVLKVFESFWRYKADQNIVCKKMGWVTKNIFFTDNRGQNLGNNVKKSNKIGQGDRTVISVLARLVPKFNFWKGYWVLSSVSTHFWDFSNIC